MLKVCCFVSVTNAGNNITTVRVRNRSLSFTFYTHTCDVFSLLVCTGYIVCACSDMKQYCDVDTHDIRTYNHGRHCVGV